MSRRSVSRVSFLLAVAGVVAAGLLHVCQEPWDATLHGEQTHKERPSAKRHETHVPLEDSTREGQRGDEPLTSTPQHIC